MISFDAPEADHRFTIQLFLPREPFFYFAGAMIEAETQA
jgi:hypothetical protein